MCSRAAALSEGEGSEEAGGRGRDGAGEDRRTEEEGSAGHGGADGAEGGPADQSHGAGNRAEVSPRTTRRRQSQIVTSTRLTDSERETIQTLTITDCRE